MSESNKSKKEKQVKFKDIILGAIVKYGLIDPIDLHLLVSEFTRSTKLEVEGEFYDIVGYYDFIEYKEDGTITLKKGLNLDDILEIDHSLEILKDKLLKGVDSRVKDFFDNLNEHALFALRKDFMRRERVVSETNILLISDNIEDYKGLINCGFKNIDYFKSIVRANAYFKTHPELLKQYHLIIKGNQNVQRCCFYGEVELDNVVDNLRRNSPVLVLEFTRGNSIHNGIHAFLSDRKIKRSWDILEQTIEEFYNRVLENILMNGILDDPYFKDVEYVPYEETINPHRFIPKTKKDLKILVLGFGGQVFPKVIGDLGLNIDFNEDNNFSLGLHVKNNLGNYDIIIASRFYSGNILGMNRESTEQCKDTGRELTLLMTYKTNAFGAPEELGSSFKINYVYGGNLTPESDINEKDMNVLRCTSPEFENTHLKEIYSRWKAILESAVSLYNEALKRQGEVTIKGTDSFRTLEKINEEFNEAYNAEEEKKKKEMEPINAFDDLLYQIHAYLSYKRSGQTKRTPQDIRIIEGRQGITVENIISGVVACSITFKKSLYKEEGLKVFTVQTRTKKGNFSKPEVVGLYTSVHEGKENTPNRPNPIQASALSSIEKKVAYAVKPIIDEVYAETREKEKQNRLKLTQPKKQ